jgi:folate-dependent tRNA-U54 methylase TrmFO/GidA
MAARAQEDPRPTVQNSYDEVTSAYARGDLTREEYDVLSDAVLEAGRAEDQAQR